MQPGRVFVLSRSRVGLLGSLVAIAGLGAPAVSAQTADDDPPRTRQEILRRQREAKQDHLVPYVISPAEARVRFLETWRLPRRLFAKGVNGFRPVVGGMPSGSGLVGGGGYIAGYDSHRLQATANARFSTRGYTAYDAGLLMLPRAVGSPVEGFLTVGSRDFTSLRYFGLGGNSSRGDRTTYRLEETSLDLGFRGAAGRFADFAGGVQWLAAGTGTGLAGTSLEERFDPVETPGFGVASDYLIYGGRVAFRAREERVSPPVGLTVELAAHRYDHTTSDRFDFTRVVSDVKLHVPLGHRNRILALRGRSSESIGSGKTGAAVPFYLMETLGGANSIRGFKEYRFRDAHNVLFNVEYRWEVWTYADFAFFYDAGKVFSDPTDLGFDRLKSSYGFGIRGHGPTGLVMRFDFAKSNEGFILHIGSGPSF